MFGGVNYNKLKTNLRLAVSRLKLMEKKKTELTQKSRKEIADFISNDKEDRARIRVEHIIREDYLVESFELLEMYCDLLAARFGLVQQMKTVDEGIEEAISSILWAAPRLSTEVPELKVIADQLTLKYGKPYAEGCRENKVGKVNPKLVHKLSVNAPPKILVEKYMMEIARSHNVPFVPDANIALQDEAAAAEAMLIDFQNRGEMGYGWAGPPNPNGMVMPGAGGAGFQQPNNVYPRVPNPQSFVPKDNPPEPFNYPNRQVTSHNDGTEHKAPPADEYKVPLNEAGQPTAPPAYTTLPPFSHMIDSAELDFPETPVDKNQPPAPPTGNEGDAAEAKKGGEEDELDFDDLNRRFEELKKKR